MKLNTYNFKDLVFNVLTRLKSNTAKKGGIAVIDQSIISAVTFLTGILLARFLRPAEYGIFVLAYAIVWFMKGIHEALVINPMMVFSAHLDGAKLRQYMASTGFFQLLLNLLIVFLILGVTVILRSYFPKIRFIQICPVLAFTIFAFQSQEFFRRMLFARMNFIAGFINDLLSYGLQFAGILFLVYAKMLSVVNAFYIVAVSFMVAALFGCFQCRNFLTIDISSFCDVMKKNWRHGKWLLGSNLAFWTSEQSYLFITAFFLGPVGPAILRACQNVVAPTHIILQSLENLLPSTASRKLTTQGLSAFKGFLKTATKIVLGLIISYCLLVSLYPEGFLRIFYRSQYKGYGIIVILIAVQYIIMSLNMINMIALRVLHKAKAIFRSYLFAGILTVIISIPLVKFFGLVGAVVGAILSVSVVFCTLRYNLLKAVKVN